ncbi:hypothetical protein ACIO3O_08550 [Streptomyces sp. NPDC087440]|uniref:hypothetical protein n=1 Tax=Streptomyces sp. NPDC087440 TaxID=3365790 RepID=UPI00382E4237
MPLPPGESEPLHALADRFDTLYIRLDDLPPADAAEYLPGLRRLLADAHDLTNDALHLLFNLSNPASHPGSVPVSPVALMTLGTAVTRSASVSTDLANAAAAQVMRSAAQRQPATPPSTRQDTAQPYDASVEKALDSLEDCAEGCRIAARLATHQPQPARVPLHLAVSTPAADIGRSLTSYQHAALHTIAQGQATLRQTAGGRRYISAPGGREILLTTYEALARNGLATRDTRTPLAFGQPLTTTDLGQRTLAHLPPAPTAPVPGHPLRSIPAPATSPRH